MGLVEVEQDGQFLARSNMSLSDEVRLTLRYKGRAQLAFVASSHARRFLSPSDPPSEGGSPGGSPVALSDDDRAAGG